MSLKTTIATVAYQSGLLSVWRQGAIQLDQLNKRIGILPRLERGALIFVFHRVCRTLNPFQPGTPVELFDLLCGHLAEHYLVLPLEELEERRLSPRPPSAAVAITFDDGYADNHELALPVLRRHGLPATVFVTTGSMEGKQLLWTSRLGWMLEHGRSADEPVQVGRWRLSLQTREERLQTLHVLKEGLKETNRAEREELLAELGEKLEVRGFGDLQQEMLNWNQLREMESHGFRAGGHTVNHPILSYEPLARLRGELRECKEELEGKLGHPVRAFAYPNGTAADYNLEVMQEVRRAGFRLACTMVFGANTAVINPYELRRVTVYAKTLPGIALQTERFFYLT